MEEEKTIDFDSFAEADSQIESNPRQDSLNGFAELKSCQVSEFKEEVEGITLKEKYVIFESIIHGSESGIVYVKEDSELYDFMLRFTTSENVSELAGQYMPVDRIKPGVYKPSSSLAIDIQEVFLDTDLFEDIQSLKNCIECGAIKYNTDAHKWELLDRDRCQIIYDDKLYSIFISACVSAMIALLLAISLNTHTFVVPLTLLLTVIFSYITHKVLKDYLLDYLSEKTVPL